MKRCAMVNHSIPLFFDTYPLLVLLSIPLVAWDWMHGVRTWILKLGI